MGKVISVLKYAFVFVFSLSQILTPYGKILLHGGVKSLYDEWSVTDDYDPSYAVTLKKNPGEDFVILNFTDLHISVDELYAEEGSFTKSLVCDLVNRVKPDLITLSGDNFSCHVGCVRWVKLLDSFGIPWAPVLGNHDGDNGNRLNEAWICQCYLDGSENCLFRVGPADMGYGNYVINITESGRVIHSLYMMDTHSKAADTESGKVNYAPNGDNNYDHLWANQIEWYEWCVKGIAESEGHRVESTAIMHIPVYQYRLIYHTMVEDGDLKPEYASLGFGRLGEGVCPPMGDNGFFTKAKELGSTTMMIFGHDHRNNLCVEYGGIRLNYAQKSGHCSYWEESPMGGSVITIGSDGHASMYHVDYPGN